MKRSRTLTVAGLALLALCASDAFGQLAPLAGGLVLKDSLGNVVGPVVGLDNKVARVAVAVGSDVVILDWDDYDGYFNSTRKPEQSGSVLGSVYFTGPGCTGSPVIAVDTLAVTVGGIRAAVAGTQAGFPAGQERLYTAPAGTPYQNNIPVASYRAPTSECVAFGPAVGGYYAQDVYDLAALFPWPRNLAKASPLFCDGFCSGDTQRWSQTEP